MTQAWTNPLLAIDSLDHLSAGRSAEDALRLSLAADPRPELRQLAIVPAEGRPVAHTGEETDDWRGQRLGADHAVVGNLLIDGSTVTAMHEAFESTAGVPLAERLLAALIAGSQAGGDRRGTRSAALLVVTTEAYPYLDLRVDDHSQPVDELSRLYRVARRALVPFVEALPTRDDPDRAVDDVLRATVIDVPTDETPPAAPSD